MDTGTIGKWLWIVGLALFLVWGLLMGLNMDVLPAIVGSIAGLAAFLGGVLYLGTMKDKTGFFIATLALVAVAPAVAAWDLFGIQGVLGGLFAGAAAAAVAGAAGALVRVVWEWVMP